MLQVELKNDDFDKSGAFVKIGRVARAIAIAKGSENLPDAERKMHPLINAGVQLGKLNPLHPDNLTPLSRSDYGNGIVFFEELVKWGRSELFDFKMLAEARDNPGNFSKALPPNFTAYGVITRAPPPITPTSGRGTSPSERRKPAAKPDWDFWLHMPEVKLWQAVALSMNIDPDSLKGHPQAWAAGPGAGPIFTEDSFPGRDEQIAFDKRLRLLVANKTAKNGFSPGTLSMDNPHKHGVRLSEFATWAPTIGWDIPLELAALAKQPTALTETKPAPAKVGAGDTPVQDNGEPPMSCGTNTKNKCGLWIAYMAKKLVDDDEVSTLYDPKNVKNGRKGAVTRIMEISREPGRGYLCDGREFAQEFVRKSIPEGTTGGRRKNGRKSQKSELARQIKSAPNQSAKSTNARRTA